MRWLKEVVDAPWRYSRNPYLCDKLGFLECLCFIYKILLKRNQNTIPIQIYFSICTNNSSVFYCCVFSFPSIPTCSASSLYHTWHCCCGLELKYPLPNVRFWIPNVYTTKFFLHLTCIFLIKKSNKARPNWLNKGDTNFIIGEGLGLT